MLNIKRIVKKLTLYKTDLCDGKIAFIPQNDKISIINNNDLFQTDASCWKKENNQIIFTNCNYVLVRKFDKNINTSNEFYYNINFLDKNELKVEDLFPIYPNVYVLTNYLNYCNKSEKSKEKCINYGKTVNKYFHK